MDLLSYVAYVRSLFWQEYRSFSKQPTILNQKYADLPRRVEFDLSSVSLLTRRKYCGRSTRLSGNPQSLPDFLKLGNFSVIISSCWLINSTKKFLNWRLRMNVCAPYRYQMNGQA